MKRISTILGVIILFLSVSHAQEWYYSAPPDQQSIWLSGIDFDNRQVEVRVNVTIETKHIIETAREQSDAIADDYCGDIKHKSNPVPMLIQQICHISNGASCAERQMRIVYYCR